MFTTKSKSFSSRTISSLKSCQYTLLSSAPASGTCITRRHFQKNLHLFATTSGAVNSNPIGSSPLQQPFREYDAATFKNNDPTPDNEYRNPYQISFKFAKFLAFDNPEQELFPKSLTKAVIIKKPLSSEMEFDFHVPRVNQTLPLDVQKALKQNLSIQKITLNQQELYGRIVLSVQNAIAKQYSTERQQFAQNLQKWAHELWRLDKRVRLGTMYFLKKHQQHVLSALDKGEAASNLDICWQGPRGTGKSLGYLLASLETARCFSAWEQDYKQPGYRVLILTPSNEQAKHLGNLLDSALYLTPEAQGTKSKTSTKPKKLQQQYDQKRRAQPVEQQDDFAFMDYEGVMNFDAPHENKVAAYKHINHVVLTNEGDLEQQIDAMDYETPEIVIATPEQLVKHLDNSNYFNNLKLLVMDDVNLLSSSFGKEIAQIKKHLREGHRSVYISDTPVEEVPENLRSANGDRQIDYIRLSALKYHQKLALPHHVVNCAQSGALFDQVAALVNRFRSKKVLITHQNNELLQLVGSLLKQHDIHTCSATELDSSEDRDFALRYYNNRDNGVLLAQDYIALDRVKVDSVDVLINLGDAQGTQSTHTQLFDLLNANAEGSYLLATNKDAAATLSKAHPDVEFKSKKLTQAKSIRNQDKINAAVSEARSQTSASIVNYFNKVLSAPHEGQWLKNQTPQPHLAKPSGKDVETAKQAAEMTLQLYDALGLSKDTVPQSFVQEAQAVSSENAMREAGLSKWFYHRKQTELLKVPTFPFEK